MNTKVEEYSRSSRLGLTYRERNEKEYITIK